MDATRAQVERRKAVPDLSLSIGAKRDNEPGRTQAIAGFSVPLPLFDRNQGALYEASRRADKANEASDCAPSRRCNRPRPS